MQRILSAMKSKKSRREGKESWRGAFRVTMIANECGDRLRVYFHYSAFEQDNFLTFRGSVDINRLLLFFYKNSLTLHVVHICTQNNSGSTPFKSKLVACWPPR